LLQIVLVLLVVTHAGPIRIPSQLLSLLTWATGFTTLVSGIAYVWVWTKKARDKGWRG
jgi:cardiolipin synthase